jgi:hypothetical protein
MPKVIADISMSLDGVVTGDGADDRHGLGDVPGLHSWVMQQDAVDTEILEQSTAQSGAVAVRQLSARARSSATGRTALERESRRAHHDDAETMVATLDAAIRRHGLERCTRWSQILVSPASSSSSAGRRRCRMRRSDRARALGRAPRR